MKRPASMAPKRIALAIFTLATVGVCASYSEPGQARPTPKTPRALESLGTTAGAPSRGKIVGNVLGFNSLRDPLHFWKVQDPKDRATGAATDWFTWDDVQRVRILTEFMSIRSGFDLQAMIRERLEGARFVRRLPEDSGAGPEVHAGQSPILQALLELPGGQAAVMSLGDSYTMVEYRGQVGLAVYRRE